MKNYILVLFIVFISCKKKEDITKKPNRQNKEVVLHKNKSINDLLLLAESYTPNTIDLSKVEFLEKFDVKYIFENKNNKTNKRKIVSVILLKQYLFHLRKANQGYNLNSMRNKNARFIIDYFYKLYNIDSNSELINSSIAFHKLKNDTSIQSKNIKDIILKIDIEISRIMKETNKIINGK